MFNDCIIMAGGSGTRLWPASNSKNPKQFLSGPGGKSFFVSALERGLELTRRQEEGKAPGQVIIIAGKGHTPHVIRAAGEFDETERRRMVLIPEPLAKNTAPAIACGAIYANRVFGGDRNMLVLTSDHIIGPLEVFAADAAAAAVFSAQGKLAVFGIPPRSAETGYGYIEAAELLSPASGGAGTSTEASGGTAVYQAAAFREKPDRATAEQFLKAGNFYWNSGMFAFSSEFMLGEFRRNSPETLKPFEALKAPDQGAFRTEGGLRILDNWPYLAEAYQAVKGISFDYAIAEKCRSVVMAAARFDWFDVGSWDEYARLMGKTGAEVYGKTDTCFVDSDIPVALCGVDDLIVVIRSGKDGAPPTALIAKKGESQGVRNIVEQIKGAGRTELL
ncbi:mannose-1-phosphate guanylyltransferase [GDP] (GDP-mannose pyrophosphorylase) (GMP) [Treponema primitia ZAS-2]|uniref:Mannose-1-phosphate guanylyltransferase [GDP] (GDP-mannose pyrophosphorylase) (GMP) n=1 Tax=Treponema primitia (strain ATCC BAA-887 / DSM 12427 / ZAS-2) TaxID=545694 RepID=F5YGV1_TREPZ|nr:mannose-1-phosphate guanylyltransferase [Treponema primitia]AEF86609.1 mannose-1-phosphate guanylyltransferase [GDP] (GDP-mannose pyrophosphorylase) (GMP) [Treponema primitia ZAS-2]